MKELFLLNPDICFLNHGSYGATPRPVFETYQYWQRELERNPVAFQSKRLPVELERAREALARYLDAEADRLCFVPNTSYGISLLARALNIGAHDEVLLLDHVYGAVERSFRLVQRQLGFSIRKAKIQLPAESREKFIEEFFAQLKSRTSVLCIDHITSPSALILPVEEICAEARCRGITTIVDGAHVPGHISLRLKSLDCDYYVGNLHKWLCAPKGAAFLYAKNGDLNSLYPLIVSWGFEADERYPFPCVHDWQGTNDYSAWLTVPEAIEFQQNHSWGEVRKRCKELASSFREEMRRKTGLEPIQKGDSWYQQMISVPLPPALDSRVLQKKLFEHYRIEIVGEYVNALPVLRASFQGYNSEADLDLLMSALQKELTL